MTASQALPEAKKRQIEARVAAWKRKFREEVRAEVLAEVMAKQLGKDGEVADVRADGQAVGKAKAGKDDDSMKTPLKPQVKRTLKIAEYESSEEDINSKMILGSTFTDEEEEVRRQYEESLAGMRQARERIRRIKMEKEERFKMRLEEQKFEERRKKEKEDEEKRKCCKKSVNKERKRLRFKGRLISAE
jgi:hypothetical protein